MKGYDTITTKRIVKVRTFSCNGFCVQVLTVDFFAKKKEYDTITTKRIVKVKTFSCNRFRV